MKWTEADLNEALQGDATLRDGAGDTEDTTKRSASMQAVAKGETRRGEMNDTERRFATLLDHTEECLWHSYERFRVRYGDGAYHSPDFLTLLSDGSLVVVEVKGHVTDAGRTRFHAAAEAVPVLRWVMVVQASPQQPWKLKYDTVSEEGAPFV